MDSIKYTGNYSNFGDYGDYGTNCESAKTRKITGAKAGQEKPHQPSIAKDDVASISKIKIIYALSDGEVKGLADGAASIMLDGTPLIGADGTPNFDNVEWEIRHGTVDQTHIAGLPNLSSEIAIGTILRSGTPWIRTITNTQLSSANINVSWSRLSETTDKNDIIGTTVDYAIDVQTDGHGYVTVLDTRIKAKTSGRYQRTHNVKLPEATQGWQIRVRKITADGDNEQTFNQMQIDSIAEIIDAKLRYPHTALLYLSFDARTFSNMPKVSVDMFGRYLKVPSNYDAETRTSTGLWDGTFKTAYTNNPAWVYYDLITNDRYGLGDRLKPFMINKWAIAHIARVCDEPVDDGKGGTEPRFTCNLYLQVDEQAYQVLQHIAGIFRGMSFWDGSQIVLDADTPRDADYVITRANVVGGAFNKSGTSIDDRHTLVQVAWSNPDNNYETDYVTVRNERAIAKYGINPLDMPAVGCTSEGQAYRHGLAALLSEQNRTQTVNFAMGLDGQLPTVGSRVDIADMMFTGANNGGRISAVSADRTTITVDRDDIPATTGDRLTVNLESGRAQTREILSVSGRNITVKAAFDPVAAENVWVIDSDELPTMPFIVLSITENEDRTQYSYTALQYDGTLQAQIDNGTIIEPTPPAPPFNPYIIQSPESVAVASRHREVQAQTVTTLVITWDQVKDAVAYDVEWRKDDGDWIKLPPTGNISVDIDGVYSGNYLARVRAVSAFDAISKPTTSTLTAITGKAGKPPALANLKVTGLLFGMRLDWAFSAGSGDTAYTEIQVGSAHDVNVTALGQFAYSTDTHTVNGLQGNLSQSYRARIVDKLGNTSDWSAWVTGTTDASADKVMDLIQGQIDESSLNESLTSKIGKISENEDAIGQETEDRIQAIIDTKKKADDAQLAATNAATLAGNKGEVIYQWQTPAAARQLAQNLWIDTTGGKNTPKRWDGSAWVAVTDKAAIDAQQAATTAQQTANEALGKANNANDSIITILDEQVEINNELGLQDESLQGVIADYKPRYADATRYVNSTRSVQWTYWKTVARDSYATNERITNLQSEVVDSNAQYVQKLETIATDTSALASEVTTLEATVGDNTASIQTRNEVIDGLSAQSTTILDVNGHVVGVGTYNDGKTGSFIADVDEFYIGSPDGIKKTFVHYPAPTTLPDGTLVPQGTWLRGDLFATGTINGDKIKANSTITAPNIEGGRIAIGDDGAGNPMFSVDSQGNLLGKSGTFEGNVLADKISGTIDIESMKRSAWTPSYRVYLSEAYGNNTPSSFSNLRGYTGSHTSYGSIEAIYDSYNQGHIVGSALFEINLTVKSSVTVNQKVVVADERVDVWVNGSKVATQSGRHNNISYTLPSGDVLLQIVLVNSEGAAKLILFGDFIDNHNIKFA